MKYILSKLIIIFFFLFVFASAAFVAVMDSANNGRAYATPSIEDSIISNSIHYDYECCEDLKSVVLKSSKNEEILSGTDYEIGIMVLDLNSDGADDFIGRIDSRLTCGSGGCSTYIFVKDNNDDNQYRAVQGPSNTFASLGISKAKSHGYHNLIFNGKNNERCTWKYNGSEYAFHYCEAEVSEFPNICADIQEMYDSNTLKNITVGQEFQRKLGTSFFADIDNDGMDEELQYFFVRTYADLSEILDGKRRGLPNSGLGSAYYSGNRIIYYKDRFLHIHFEKGPYEIQELVEMTPEELASRSKNSRARYNVKTLCRYYRP